MSASETGPDRPAPPADPRDPAELLEGLAESFFAAYHRGERPTVEEYAQRHPDLAKEIREVLPALILMEELGDDAGQGQGSGRTSSASRAPRERPPQQLGEYRIVREVGRGGMGVVYEAVQETLGRRVALKVLPADSLSDARRLERFLREARAAARLQHTHIVPVFAVGEHEGTHFYAMQFVRGQGLDAVLREAKSAGPRNVPPGYFVRAARLSLQVADALAYAHAEGILHRDIKPSNLLLDTRGDIWVTDFGLAKAEGSADLTHTGDIVGTLRYMPPERFRGWSDVRSDIYSLGLTLYELVTLTPAFEASERSSLIRKVLEENPPRPRRIAPQIPNDLETIILKASEKEPGHRYVSAAEMSDDLRRFLAGEPIKARTVGSLERSWRWCQRNPLLAGLASSVAALIVTVAIVSSVYAVRLGESNRDSQQNLRSAYVEQARALRYSGRAGRRFEALDAVRKAAGIRSAGEQGDVELRNEAIACMALEDVRVAKEWKEERGTAALAFDSRVERFVVNPSDGSPGLDLRSAKDGAVIRRIRTGFSRQEGLLFSPEDRYLAVSCQVSGGDDCHVFDLSTDSRVLHVQSLPRWKPVAFLRDSREFAAGLTDGSVRIFDLENGKESRKIQTPFNIEHLAVRPDDSRIAIANHLNGQILVVDLETDKRVWPPGLPTIASWLAWSPRGDLLAAACMDNFTYVFDTSEWRIQSVLERHDGSVMFCAFNHRGDLLATSGWDVMTRLWDPWSGRMRLQVAGNLCGGFSDDDQRLGFSRSHTHWGVWEVAAARELRVLGRDIVPTNEYPRVDFSPDGRVMAFVTDHGFGLWDLETSRRLTFVNTTKELAVVFERDGQGLVVAGRTGLAYWPLHREAERMKLGPPLRLAGVVEGSQLAFSRDGARLIVAEHVTSRALVIDWRKKVVIQQLPHSQIFFVDLNPSGEVALTGTWNGHGVKVWNVDTGALIKEIPITTSASVLFSPDGVTFLTCDYREYCLWSTATLTPLYHLPLIEEGAPHPADISPDGRWIALSRSLGITEIVDLSTGDLIARLDTPDVSHFGSVRFNRDGARLAASPRTSIQLWDLRRVRDGLRPLGLDWNPSGSYPPPSFAEGPLELDVEMGALSLHTDWIAERWKKIRGWLAEQNLKVLAAPGDAWNYYNRGWLRNELSDWKGAVEDYEKCLLLDPTCYLAMNNLAWILVIGPEDLRRPERAAALARECLEYDPDPPTTKNTLGAALYRLGKYEEGVRWLGEAARRSILDDLALNELFLAMCHWKLGNSAIARRYYRQALEASGESMTPNRDLNAVRAEAETTLGIGE